MISEERLSPFYWVGLSILILILDYFSGEAIQFPVLYLIPVGFAAWFGGRTWGFVLALILASARIVFWSSWEPQWSLAVEGVNAAIRAAAFSAFAFFVSVARQKTEEVLALQGLLPICSFCKSIRDQSGEWQPLEAYIVAHTAASLTHGICPKCARKHYSQFVSE